MSASEVDVVDPAVDTAEEGEDAAKEETASTLKRKRAGKLSQLTQLVKKAAAALEEGLGIETLKDLHRRISGQLRSLEALDRECTEQCEVEGLPPPSSMKAKEMSAVAMMEGISACIAEQEQVARNTGAVSVISRASSNRSRRSNASNASRAAAQELEIANLRLSQQRAREESERLREEQEHEEEEARLRREREARRKKRERESQKERELLEQEVEVAALRERLTRAAEDDLAWERRADFDDSQEVAVVNSGRALVHDQPSLTNTERITLLQSSLAGPAAQAVSGMLYNGALYGKALETLQARFGREEDIELGIAGDRRDLRLQNVEGAGPHRTSERVSLKVSPADDAAKRIVVAEAWAVPEINVTAPRVAEEDLKRYQHLSGLSLSQYDGGCVTLLLGANVLEAVLQREVRSGRPGQPVAIRTDLGWALTGSISTIVPSSMRQVCYVRPQRQDEEPLVEAVKEWWTTESFGTRFERDSTRSREDDRAISILEASTRKIDGRYEVHQLWRAEDIVLPNNKSAVIPRLQALERKLERQPEVAEAYRKTIAQYLEDGHARKLTEEMAKDADRRRWFLPHHAVLNPNKPRKVRVVFDAAASYRGTSLNNQLLSGPDLLQSLPGVLLRFRERAVAVSGDIRQMYHQIRMAEVDQPAMSFLWRDLDVSRPPDVYQMCVAIFGARSSPAIANYVLGKCLEENWPEDMLDLAQNGDARRSFYMDDLLCSADDSTTALRLKEAVTHALAKGGFEITQWRSSDSAVLVGTAEDERGEPGTVACPEPAGAMEKALGVAWEEQKDVLGFRLRDITTPMTKRGLLSQAAAVFDPLGIAAPFTVRAKTLMQSLWPKQLGWDEPLPEPERSVWLQWVSEKEQLGEVSIQRCLVPSGKIEATQLHVFCDASEDAFGAVAYLRTTDEHGRHACRFVMAKTRVAPLKRISIVRLELQAALLGARMAHAIMQELTRPVTSTTFWTDSAVVLSYVSSESHRFKAFVANRVAEIHELTTGAAWRHVPGVLNPADACTRGMAASALTTDCKWLCGPDFLQKEPEDWPQPALVAPPTTGEEEISERRANTVGKEEPMTPDPGRFSSWLRYKRVVAWMLRFARNAAIPVNDDRRKGQLSQDEILGAEKRILLMAQKREYPVELRKLEKGEPLPPSSSLRPLTPVIDGDGVMRVGGRLTNAPLSRDARHPVVLPRQSGITRLIIAGKHAEVAHAGPEHTLSAVRECFWIPRGREAVKTQLRECPVCRRRRAEPSAPQMAPLPPARFDGRRPFSSAGIDFFGPFYVRYLRRTQKRYGFLATCMATRAVHLEMVHALDADSCLLALRRFFARRGKPECLFSDNGTNFVGSYREIRKELQLMEKLLGEKLSGHGIEWHFNPPAAPHMGGVWERLVRSVKRCLTVVLGSQTLTDEVLSTVFAEVEYIVNSRPLTHVSADPADMEAITPNHFLLGRASPRWAPCCVDERDMCSRRRWKQAQSLAEGVWRRWAKEYLPTLTQRRKWSQETRSLKNGDLVLMAETGLTRSSWPLARVVKVFPGADAAVRAAEVRTAGGKTYTRPATKLALLEGDI
ncbi:uncharacterized protein LOC122392683 [Amphibalanus amphitrite]|uniref:uncharacterized protein LOC122392683 n=1 Tax=Amphibalanus amphitrite TaxID=1232801 RepID=UPI001C91BBD7|nr:uncharacterized protein LOC122392683 [Amphibalanus amphitrite]